MAQGVDVRPAHEVAWLPAQSAHLGFVVEKVTVRQFFVQPLSFSLVSVIPSVLRIYSLVTDPV